MYAALPAATVISDTDVSLNAPVSMFVTLAGMVIPVNLKQPLNA